MWIDDTRYEPHTFTLRPFEFFFQLLHWFLELQICFIKWYEKERNIKLRVHNGGWDESLNFLHVSSCEMFNKKRKQTFESARYGLEIITS